MRQCPDHYAIRAGQNLPDKEFRYLRTVIVTAAVYRGLSSVLRLLLHFPLTFRHRAGVTPYTSPFGFAESCVFDKQLPGPFHCGLLAQAPLLPKLRGQYAEFLNNPSPVGLRILSSSTCVGLRYGRLRYTYTFSRHCLPLLPYYFQSLSPGATIARVRVQHCVSVLKFFGGYGISTVCASTTPSGLALAPGLPGADEPTPGNLRFSTITILTQFSLLIPAFSLLYSPPLLPLRLHPVYNAPLPIFRCLSFGYTLSPVKSSAQHHSTSELLRTLLMSGCF